MKKTISIILMIMVLCALTFGLVACGGDDPPTAYEMTLTSEDAEIILIFIYLSRVYVVLS